MDIFTLGQICGLSYYSYALNEGCIPYIKIYFMSVTSSVCTLKNIISSLRCVMQTIG